MGLYLRLGRGRRRRQRTWQLIPQNLQEPSPTGDGSSGCRKSRWLFSTACNNAGVFVSLRGTKILASLHARLAEQGLARHLIRFEAGFAPSSSPVRKKDCTHGRGLFYAFFCGKRSTRSATRSAYRLSGKRGEYPTGGATEGEGGDTTSVRLSFYTSCRNLSTGFFPQWRGKRRLSGWGRELFYCLYGTCQMVSAYWAMARSAANTPLRAMLVRLMRFHLVRSS